MEIRLDMQNQFLIINADNFMDATFIKKQIPNTITGLNLFSGCISIVFAFQQNFEWAFYFILFAAIFDFFDGMAARALKVSSPIGKELDSLADVVSFGVAPSMMLFNFFNENIKIDYPIFLLYLVFLIPVFSAFRLAKFNLDTRQSTSFLGLPTPANALFWASYVFLPNFSELVHNPYVIIGLIIITSLLLVSELPMFAFKFKTFGLKDNAVTYLFVIFVIVLGLFVDYLSLGSVVVFGYILLNTLMFLFKR